MARSCFDIFSFFKIGEKCFQHFVAEINNDFIAAFSKNFNTIIFQINIFDIQTDTFGNTDTCSEKKGHKSQITDFGPFVVGKLFGCQLFTGFDIIQESGNFIDIQTDNVFFMKLWRGNERSRIGNDEFLFKIVIIKSFQGSQFPGDALFGICVGMSVSFIEFQIFQIFFNIQSFHLIQYLQRNIPYIHFGDRRIIFLKKFKEYS